MAARVADRRAGAGAFPEPAEVSRPSPPPVRTFPEAAAGRRTSRTRPGVPARAAAGRANWGCRPRSSPTSSEPSPSLRATASIAAYSNRSQPCTQQPSGPPAHAARPGTTRGSCRDLSSPSWRSSAPLPARSAASSSISTSMSFVLGRVRTASGPLGHLRIGHLLHLDSMRDRRILHSTRHGIPLRCSPSRLGSQYRWRCLRQS